MKSANVVFVDGDVLKLFDGESYDLHIASGRDAASAAKQAVRDVTPPEPKAGLRNVAPLFEAK